ncbi:hypothetical protein PR202_ga23758 [Eleusine coracana subsp. coracana]|uniref:Reverse transcriptase zinc-binding domain-containing protein n=1 Tax=Eleusine coracana subsp. coracana TaxID=191504 RepID=A0AAV5D7G9_ELECO|nr:hypothetical protein PR202_ga23758 [Eleusine coracana subsp. coracana]
MSTEIGNGASTLFWEDRWLLGQRIQDLSPLISGMVPKRISNKRTVSEAITDMCWVRDIHGIASLEVITEFIKLWDIVSGVMLQPEVEDVHMWQFSTSGKYMAKSAYDVLFQGAISFEPWERIWKTWTPGKCQFFMWLAAHLRCWTVDRLARKNLPHPESCLMCDQEDETIDHLLVGCVFACQFWHFLLNRIGHGHLAPLPDDLIFREWWAKVTKPANSSIKKGLNSYITLGAWVLWRHRNDCVFNGASPNLATVLRTVGYEVRMWSMAGAKGLSLLTSYDGEAVVG